jgi:hypothetical protein
MNGKLYYLGRNAGWRMAGIYATGTRRQRAAIRQRLEVLKDSYSRFAAGVWDGFADRAEQRSEAIRAGIAPRTINPRKLEQALERISA